MLVIRWDDNIMALANKQADLISNGLLRWSLACLPLDLSPLLLLLLGSGSWRSFLSCQVSPATSLRERSVLTNVIVDIYKNYAVSVMLIQNFLLGAVYQSYLYYVPLYLQNAHQYSVMTSALLYMPMVITQCISSIVSGQYISRYKRYGEVIMFGFGTWTL